MKKGTSVCRFQSGPSALFIDEIAYRLQASVDQVKNGAKGLTAEVKIVKTDFSSLASIRKAASEINGAGVPIHVRVILNRARVVSN